MFISPVLFAKNKPCALPAQEYSLSIWGQLQSCPAIHFFLEDFSRCESADADADFDVLLVRPSRNTADAALAAFLPVFSVRVLDCVNALPAPDFDAFPVDLDESVFAAAFAALGLVCFDILFVSFD